MGLKYGKMSPSEANLSKFIELANILNHRDGKREKFSETMVFSLRKFVPDWREAFTIAVETFKRRNNGQLPQGEKWDEIYCDSLARCLDLLFDTVSWRRAFCLELFGFPDVEDLRKAEDRVIPYEFALGSLPPISRSTGLTPLDACREYERFRGVYLDLVLILQYRGLFEASKDRISRLVAPLIPAEALVELSRDKSGAVSFRLTLQEESVLFGIRELDRLKSCEVCSFLYYATKTNQKYCGRLCANRQMEMNRSAKGSRDRDRRKAPKASGKLAKPAGTGKKPIVKDRSRATSPRDKKKGEK